jgi:signal peptidase I
LEHKFLKKEEENPGLRESILDYFHDLIYILTVVVLLCLVFFRVVVVSGSSMYNTLLDGDYLLLISNVFYRNPQPGDIVVASKESFDNGAPIVKRVIATEGQTVDIDFGAGIVYVDGVALEEDYTYTMTNMDEGVKFPQVVEEGHVFLMGDNRNRSKDSRSPEIGQVDRRELLGKAIFLFVPGTHFGNDPFDISRIGVLGK